MVTARLQSDIHRASGRVLRTGCQSFPLGMEASVLPVPAFPYHPSILDDNSPHKRIRIDKAPPVLRKLHRPLHVFYVLCTIHFT